MYTFTAFQLMRIRSGDQMCVCLGGFVIHTKIIYKINCMMLFTPLNHQIAIASKVFVTAVINRYHHIELQIVFAFKPVSNMQGNISVNIPIHLKGIVHVENKIPSSFAHPVNLL